MEALIRVELDIISPNCPTNNSEEETLHIANIQFNNLDVVGRFYTQLVLEKCLVNDSLSPEVKLPWISKVKFMT